MIKLKKNLKCWICIKMTLAMIVKFVNWIKIQCIAIRETVMTNEYHSNHQIFLIQTIIMIEIEHVSKWHLQKNV